MMIRAGVDDQESFSVVRPKMRRERERVKARRAGDV
jgi:hypothetical protein